MVQGVDVWLNTPTRPLEASGNVSGEKAVMNGVDAVLRARRLVGRRLPGGRRLDAADGAHASPSSAIQDELDAETDLQRPSRSEIAPKYYARDAQGNVRTSGSRLDQEVCLAEIALELHHEPHAHRLRGTASTASSPPATREHARRRPTAWRARSRRGNARSRATRGTRCAWSDARAGRRWARRPILRRASRTTSRWRSDVAEPAARGHRRGDGRGASRSSDGNNVKVVAKRGLIQLARTRVEGSAGVLRASTSTPEDDRARSTWRCGSIPKQSANLPHRMDFALVKWA